ncbi:NAD(P)-binding protein [Lindgomyces ingoldianus]|uniref:NAD(P)-binding protein n=1 Tax=Lindgomyces ingoldianus TaxID=673940 RepID=A0ACB6QXN7_9PLEO|nr:NAD(P)-binding protein [Lindgomyces ingoldianus]KAF2470840.1 NAD(P)-binding protein [Lindgomyces ingoldianus]
MAAYLITGASREGLGRALVEALLSRPENTVIAGVRDLRSAKSLSLTDLPCADSSRLIVVKIDSASDTDAADAARTLSTRYGIDKIDVVVANAGSGNVYGDLSAVNPGEVKDLIDVNGVGPLRLFQAVRGFLEKSEAGKFVLIGTPIASIGAMEKAPWPMFAYGASKVVAHYLTRKIHWESQTLTAFVVDPGFMQTDMGNAGARYFGYDEAFVPVENSCQFILRQIEEATRETLGGRFVTIDES